MMNPTATVETSPVLVDERPALQGYLVQRTYRMRVNPHAEEPVKNFKPGECMTFTLIGLDPDPRDLVPGAEMHITIVTRKQGQLIGIGISLERYGCCDNCEREGTVQFTPERPGQNHCKHCVSRMWDESVAHFGPLRGSIRVPREPGRTQEDNTGTKRGPEE